jgi:hypothetical protein
VSKNGVVIWRTPLEHSLIHKRPRDQERFASLLDQLENMFVEVKHPQNRQVHEEVLDAISRVRRDLAKETAYMPTALQALETKVADYMAHSRNAATQARKEQMDTLLELLIEFGQRYSSSALVIEGSNEMDFVKRRQTIQQQTKKYLECNWMQTPWLTTHLLNILLDCELAILDENTKLTVNSPREVLRIVRNEVNLECYDSDESIRRLQHQESNGLFINSLIYPLLRLNSLSSNARQKSFAASKFEGSGN